MHNMLFVLQRGRGLVGLTLAVTIWSTCSFGKVTLPVLAAAAAAVGTVVFVSTLLGTSAAAVVFVTFKEAVVNKTSDGEDDNVLLLL